MNQGIKYTVEADTSKAEKALKETGDKAKKSGEAAVAGFSPMKALTSTLHGDFAGLGSEVAKLVPAFRKMGNGGAAAEKQYEKDFDKLKFRRDWRTAKNLSVDEEATRRVALAKEEEAAAQKYVEETAANTQRAADAVEAIRAAIEGAGNVD